MYKFIPFIKYKVGDVVYQNGTDRGEHFTLDITQSENSLKIALAPKEKLELLAFELSAVKKMAKDEVFFANGYQSWTTCFECRAGDTVKGVTPIAKISKRLHSLPAISGDYKFAEYDRRGSFHSFTYTYFRTGNDVELYGSLSERTAYTVFKMDCGENSFKVTKDVEGMTVDSPCVLLDMVSFRGGYDEVFDCYFGSMELRRPKVERLSGYTSWYNYFQKINEKIILRDLDGLDRASEEVSIFQIDDGYESFVGDWLTVDPVKFPNGMKPIAKAIHDKGYLAGIWVAPFSAQRASVVAKEHPDWLIKDNETGKPLLGCVAWNGAYTLDFYNPEVREYIKHFFDVILNDWGFDMVKLDFLYSEAMQPRGGKSRGAIMCEAMDFLRECVGEEKLILGCGVPLGPAFGVVDACRISCDVALKYKGEFYDGLNINLEVPSAKNAINNSILRRHLNRRVFCSDPDVFFLRRNNLKFTWEQKLLLAKVNNLCGDVLFVSDNAGDYTPEETEYLKKFFRPSNAEIISAEYVTAEDILVKYIEDGKKKNLRFNIKTGKSNIKNIL